MKKKIMLFFLLALFFSADGSAQEFAYSLGVKSWHNNFKIKQSDGSLKSNYGLMAGPELKVSYGRWFSGASLMVSTSDYDFKGSTKLSRNDLDLLFG